jgi:leukotriene-A4 hydrolase
MLRKILLVVLTILLGSCGEHDSYDPAHDYFTFANTDQFITRHIALDLDVDFETKKFRGNVVLHLTVIDDSAETVTLDTRDLDIKNVAVVATDGSLHVATFEFGDVDAVMGTPLHIATPDDLDIDSDLVVRIAYETSPGASALMWLPAELTAGGKQPMVFSQSQAIHARSWIPLQDTPSVRVTYEATIRTPVELLAVMSANNDPLAPRRGEFHFEMPQPIPSYLIALAVGNLYFAPIGDVTGVYTEPELLDASVYEFGQVQDMLDVAEKNFGPYQWGRYDLLVLPPSFPYGGMENPRLSFLTPSLLAGDRSLVSVVAHELAHSWSGNLVTNETWRDGWLNEGMTSYLESRLMEIIYDVDRADEAKVLDYEELLLNFESVPIERQSLAPRLDSGDPDDVQGIIHYHKGRLFLEHLEIEFGREKMDEFLLAYFEKFAFKTINSEVFLDYLDYELLSVIPDVVSREDVEGWLYQPGLPDDAPIPTSRTLSEAALQAQSWASGEVELQDVLVDSWSPQAMRHFINSLPVDLTQDQLTELDAHFNFSTTSNAEIGRTWFIQVATRRFEPAYDDLEVHLNRFSRTRLVAVIYGALASNGHDLELAETMFGRARHAYHPITITAIERKFAQSKEEKI